MLLIQLYLLKYFMLKSLIITLGELLAIFQIIFSKMKLKQIVFICGGL
jgi:hypothetical protein